MTNYFYVDFINIFDPMHPMLKDTSDDNKALIKTKVDKLIHLKGFLKFNEIRSTVTSLEGDIYVISLSFTP